MYTVISKLLFGSILVVFGSIFGRNYDSMFLEMLSTLDLPSLKQWKTLTQFLPEAVQRFVWEIHDGS